MNNLLSQSWRVGKSGPSVLYSCRGRNVIDLSERRIYLCFHSRPDAPRGSWAPAIARPESSKATRRSVQGSRGDHAAMPHFSSLSMFEDGSAALWLALNPKNDSSPTEIPRFQQGRLVSVIGSKHPLPGCAILKEVREVARDQEGGILLFDRNPGLFRLADGIFTRIANALRAVRASSTMTFSARSPRPTDFPLSPSSAWPKTTKVTGGLPPMLEF
jgi:hypothetical protein